MSNSEQQASPSGFRQLERTAAEREFIRKLERSHRYAILYFLGPFVLLSVIGYFSHNQIRAAAEPIYEIRQATSGLRGATEVEKIRDLRLSVGKATSEIQRITEETSNLKLQIVYLEALYSPGQPPSDTGPARCGLIPPDESAFIFFGLRNADSTPAIEAYLDTFLESLKKKRASGSFIVHGFADPIGTQRFNQQVSSSRVRAVTEYLRDQPASRGLTFIEAPHGASCPAPEDPTGKRNPCRRLVVVVPESAGIDYRQFCSTGQRPRLPQTNYTEPESKL